MRILIETQEFEIWQAQKRKRERDLSPHVSTQAACSYPTPHSLSAACYNWLPALCPIKKGLSDEGCSFLLNPTETVFVSCSASSTTNHKISDVNNQISSLAPCRFSALLPYCPLAGGLLSSLPSLPSFNQSDISRKVLCDTSPISFYCHHCHSS